MAIDQRDVSSTLRFMDDRALQQYAAMHKNDPYIFPLAFQESQNRQRLRMSKQAQMAQQPQPKVAEQALAQMAPQMLPEEQGIGALPAGNMQEMADGGIAGYEGYDEGPSDFGQGPVMMMAGGGVAGYSGGGPIKVGPELMRFLKSMGVDLVEFAAMSEEAKDNYIEMFEKGKAAPTAATSSAAPATQAAQGASKAYTAGQAVRPYIDKAGKLIKSGAVPVIGGGLSAAQGLSEVDAAQAFYNDPNVPLLEKGKQFARTGANVALPYVGGVIGSGVAPIAGTAGGAALGAGVAALIDDEGEALRQYRAKNEPSTAPSGATIRSQLNRADAATYAQPGVDNAPVAGPAPSADTRLQPSSVLSPSTLANTGGGRGSPSLGASSSKDTPDIFSLEGLKATRNEVRGDDKYRIGELRNQLVDVNSRANARVQERLDLRKKELAEEGDIYKDRSDRLVERGKKLEAQEDKNMGLALLNAGLAIMSTPGSLATALGKGAQVGTAQYAAGLDKLRAAQERLEEAKDRIDDLRLNRKDLNAREIRALEKDRDVMLADGEKAVYSFAKDVYNLNRGDADKLFETYVSARKAQYEQDQMTKRTLATINASNDSRTKQLWAGLMQKHGNDPVAAAKEYNAIEAGDKPTQVAEKMVQDRVGEWEKANKMALAVMTPAERTAALRTRTEQFRNDIYTQLKLSPTMGAGASSNSGFKFRGVEPAP